MIRASLRYILPVVVVFNLYAGTHSAWSPALPWDKVTATVPKQTFLTRRELAAMQLRVSPFSGRVCVTLPGNNFRSRYAGVTVFNFSGRRLVAADRLEINEYGRGYWYAVTTTGARIRAGMYIVVVQSGTTAYRGTLVLME
jgi:hypothetical protein